MNAKWVKYLPRSVRSKLAGRRGLQAVIGNTGWLIADKVIRLGVGLFVSVWIARYLGPAQFGLWSFAMAFAALFGAFATLGLDGIVVRELVKTPERQNELMGSAFALKLAGGVATLLLAVGAMALVRPGERLTLLLVALSAAGFIFQSMNVVDFYFQARVQSRYTVYAANAAFILMTLTKIALLMLSAPLVAFALAGLGEAILTALFLLIAYRLNHHRSSAWRYRTSVAVELLKHSWPLILSSLAIMVYMRIDQIMIGQMLGDKEVGLFSAAVKISEVWYFVPTAIVSSVFPAIILAKQQNEELYLGRLQRLYDLMVILALSIAIPLTIFSDELMSFLFGSAYQSAGSVLALHIWGGIFVFLGVASSQWYLAENLQTIAFSRAVVGAVVNILLNLVLIPSHGLIGAAVATIFAQLVAAYLFDGLSNRTRPQFWAKTNALVAPLRLFSEKLRESNRRSL